MSLIPKLPFTTVFLCAAEMFSLSASANITIKDFTLSGVSLEHSTFKGEPAFKMTMPTDAIQDPKKEKLADRNYMAWLPFDFGDGVIEVDIASKLVDEAPTYARGFIGLTFRIDSKGHFESIYLRPTNSVAEDQVRRNHSVQYVAYPDYRFDKLRQESPEKYESYAELDMERWIHMKIVVKGEKAELYLDGKSTPSLIVTDLKLGANQRGGVGVWLESGTMAFFRNLKITPAS